MSDDDSISCDAHGTARATFLCGHLAEDPVQRWHGEPASADHQWPDAWCDRCNETWLRDGAWNDSNSGALQLKIFCHHCYEHAKGRNVGRLSGASQESWRDFVETCTVDLQRKMDRLDERFAIAHHARWDWNQDRAEIVFSNDGVPAVVATIAFVGTLSRRANTWMWSWMNTSLTPAVVGGMARVRDYGEALNRPHLNVPIWPADETDGWEMTAVAAHLLDAEGAYRTPDDRGFTYMILSNVRAAA